MNKNERVVIPINTVLYATALIIILGTIIFIYNAIQMQNTEIANTNENNVEETIAKVAGTSETLDLSQREEQTETARTDMINRTETTIQQTEMPIEETKTYTKIEDVKISKDMDLTVRTNLSKEDFKILISNVKQDTSKFFYENSDTIYDLCEKYELNEIFFCGLISAESGWNIAENHRRTHNYISLMSKGKLLKYNSVEEGLEIATKTMHQNYLTKGGKFYHGKTLSAVKKKFCPASSTWVNLVYGRMQQII